MSNPELKPLSDRVAQRGFNLDDMLIPENSGTQGHIVAPSVPGLWN